MKKALSLIIVITILASLLTPTLISAQGMGTFTVSTVRDTAGATVDVAIRIENNPGILGAVLTFEFDEEITLLGGTKGDAFEPLTMTPPGVFASPCNYVFDAMDLSDEDIADGVILTLRFKVPDDAQAGTKYNIMASYDEGGIQDRYKQDISPAIVNGYIEVLDFVYGDLNSDKRINTGDVTLMRRHIAKGYDQVINEKAADVNLDSKINTADVILTRQFIAGGYEITFPYVAEYNHIMEYTPAKAATEEEPGNIEYWRCKTCGKYFKDESGKNEIAFEKIVIPVLQKSEYLIQYVCDMVPLGTDNRPITYEPDTYKPAQTKILPTPKMDTYKFLGWSDKNGRMYGTEIPKGTTGDLVLYANWASNRNKAIPVGKLGDPIICEDSENGQILFIYEIGRIENIPMFETQDLLVANGLVTSTGVVKQTSITKGNAEEIGKTIANTTTNSSTWTLSKDWNETTSISEEWAEQHGMTTTEAEEFCKSNSNSYNMTNSSGGSSSLVNSDSSAYRISGNQAHSESTYDEDQKYTNFNIDGKLSNSTTASLGINAGLSLPIKGVNASLGAEAGISNTFAWEIGAGYNEQNYTKDISTGTDSWENNIDIANSKSSTATSSKTWNSTEGYSSSSSTSSTSSVAKAVSELISQKHSKDSSYTTGGSEGESKEYASSNANEDKYSSTVTYSEADIEISERKFESTGNTYGAYRLVQVGMARVFAVVGYDIKNKAYYTSTYSILDDDEYKEYLDYSYDRTFNDYETSTLPFEIPFFVNDYVNSRIASSKLQIDDSGIVTKYLGEVDDEIVLIPSYYTKNNTTTGESEMHKIKGIVPGLFKGNTNIIGVSLGNFINEISESAFEGCTALKEVLCPNVLRIGANAFKGCSSLSEFSLPNEIDTIGENAFDGIPALKSNAPTKEIANIVANSNVQNITLDISKIEADDFSDMSFNIGEIESFKLLGGYKEYKGLNICSDAHNTIISGVTISDCDVVPIEVSSPNVTLERVSAYSDGFALILKAAETTLSIEGVSNMLSESPNSIISKNINFAQVNDETYSTIETNENVLVCGVVNNNDGYIPNEKIIIITEDEYENYLTSRKVTFDANGGTIATEYMIIPYNSKFGELPFTSRDYYTFDGWYLNPQTTDGVEDEQRGDRITSESVMTSLTDMTLYAHWLQNAPSPWVLKSDMPKDAQVVDTKYSYTLTSYTTSTSSSLSGWTKYDTKRTAWGGTQGPVYSNPSNGSRNVWSEQYVSSTTTHYKYYHRCNYAGSWGSDSSAPGWTRHSCDLTYPLSPTSTYDTGIQFYGSYECPDCHALRMWIPDGTYTSNNYSTRWYYQEPIYTYYYNKTEIKESPTYPTGDNISDIEEWVQYRIK